MIHINKQNPKMWNPYNLKMLEIKREFLCSQCYEEFGLKEGLSTIYETVQSCKFHIEHNHLSVRRNPKPLPIIRFYRASGYNGFLSNLYHQSMIFEEKLFFTAEAAYQYGKPKDKRVAEWLIAVPKPHLCAIAAHGLLVYDIREDWQEIKVDRMRAVLEAKFGKQNPILQKLLLATGDALLVEESTTDAFWGIGKNRKGKNMLGMLLMDLRAKLSREEHQIICPHCRATLPDRDAGSICPNCLGIIPDKEKLEDWWGVRCLGCNQITFDKLCADIKECGYCGNKDKDKFINTSRKDFA